MRYLLVIIASLLPFLSAAQLTAPGLKAVRFTRYESSPGVNDPIFIFCNSTGSQRGALSAASPDNNVQTFSWYRWNDATKDFTDFIKSETGLMSSLSDVEEGGYKVVLSGGASFTGWVFLDRPPVAGARLLQGLCERIALDGDTAAAVPRYFYNNIYTGVPLSMKNEISFLWSAQPSTFIPSPDLRLDPVIVNVPPPQRQYRLPLEDVTFKLRVNSLGCSSEASFFYKSIHVKADFTADPVEGEAPLEVVFTDKSVRGTGEYIWDFGEKNPDGSKKTWKVGKDSLSMFADPFTHTYYRPGEYQVKLSVQSEMGCVDTITLTEKIKVEKSKLEIPNVFTPNGDNFNSTFRVASASLRWISVEVFSRSGLKVYSFFGEGESLRAWQGWDGHVNQTSAEASPGVYFYIIRALGWDDIGYDGKEYRGFVYLYR